jgi:phosphomannomutase
MNRATVRISHVGLRGIVGAGGMTAAHAMDFAAAFGEFLSDGPVVISRDTRSSGVMFREGIVSSLQATGHDVIDLGIVSTPVLQHAIRGRNAAGGISISASHNGAEWNALKFFGASGTYLSTAEAGELLDIFHLRKFHFVEWDRIGSLHQESQAIDSYLDDLENAFDFPALRRFRIVVDCCNGTSSLILRRLIDRHRFHNVHLINEQTEGVTFAHEPAINKQVVGLQLAPLIRPLGADAGFLFDADSDRVAIATEMGEAISEELVLPMLADHQLESGAGSLVITNISTTALLEDIAHRHEHSRVIRVPVGRQAAMDALATYKPEQIAIAGEGTGAVMMPQFRFVYDGIASMLAILSMMEHRGQSLTEILGGYPRHSILKGQIPLVSQRIPALFLELHKRFEGCRINTLDGFRVDLDGAWAHVRVSQTEPIVRLICEQRGDAPKALYDSILELVETYAAA